MMFNKMRSLRRMLNPRTGSSSKIRQGGGTLSWLTEVLPRGGRGPHRGGGAAANLNFKRHKPKIEVFIAQIWMKNEFSESIKEIHRGTA